MRRRGQTTATSSTGDAVDMSSAEAKADAERRGYVAAAIADAAAVAVSRSHSVVYGTIGDDLVFIPEPRARFLAKVWHALLTSNTWGALKKRAPRTAYDEIREHNADALEPSEMRPTAVFDYYEMTGVPSGDYPGFPRQEMLAWLPEDIQLDFGHAGTTALTGEFLRLNPDDATAILRRLQQAGFRCRRNQRLMDQAHGD
jgi:hypothetical protein